MVWEGGNREVPPYPDWQRAGIWNRLLAAVQAHADAQGQLNWDVHFIDGTMIRAHQHAAGAKRGAQRPQPSAAAGVDSVPRSICAPKGGAS